MSRWRAVLGLTGWRAVLGRWSAVLGLSLWRAVLGLPSWCAVLGLSGWCAVLGLPRWRAVLRLPRWSAVLGLPRRSAVVGLRGALRRPGHLWRAILLLARAWWGAVDGLRAATTVCSRSRRLLGHPGRRRACELLHGCRWSLGKLLLLLSLLLRDRLSVLLRGRLRVLRGWLAVLLASRRVVHRLPRRRAELLLLRWWRRRLRRRSVLLLLRWWR